MVLEYILLVVTKAGAGIGGLGRCVIMRSVVALILSQLAYTWKKIDGVIHDLWVIFYHHGDSKDDYNNA